MNGMGPSLRSCSLWARQETRFLNVIRRALEILRANRPHPAAEVDLNRLLYFALLESSRELDPKGILPPPTQEACNQPDPDDTTRAAREAKRPDFQWGFFDLHEPDVRRSAKQFVVECKRLGDSGRKDWVLNENYVAHGVARFVLREWSYAQRFPSALMIGYWRNMDIATILTEVNCAATAHSLPILESHPDNQLGSRVNELEHALDRPFPISPFRLRHWWVGLR
jgi:hypothetical protein